MKTRNIILILAVLAAAAFLAGFIRNAAFPKASELQETSALKNQDRLAGVYLTKEPVSSGDEAAFIPQIIDHIYTDYDITARQNAEKIYAVLKECTRTDDAGKEEKYLDYLFEDIVGIPFYMVKIRGDFDYMQLAGGEDNVLTDVRTHIIGHEDSGDSISLSGTLNLIPGEDGTWYLNPVYQQEDGQVYLVPGEGLAAGGSLIYGSSITVKITETYTETVRFDSVVPGSAETNRENAAEVTFKAVSPPEKVRVLQFDEENRIVGSDEFLPGQYPESIRKMKETSWLCVETVSKDADGKETSARQLIQPDEEFVRVFSVREDNVAAARLINIVR